MWVVAKTIQEQLIAAWEASGLTQPELGERAGLGLSQPTLSRRLSRCAEVSIPFTTEEAEKVARALGITIVGGRRARTRAA